MKNINTNEVELVAIDYTSLDLPEKARQLQPIVFMDGTAYCCLLGPDPQTGVFARGNTPVEAIENWVKELPTSLDRTDLDPEVREVISE